MNDETQAQEAVLEKIQVPGKPAEPQKPKGNFKGPDQLAAAKADFQKLLKAQKGEKSAEEKIARREKAKSDPYVILSAEEEQDHEAPQPEVTLATLRAKSEKEAPAPEKTQEIERLRAKLLLAGAPKKSIESLSEQELGEWWQKQEERERAHALSLQRASDAEKKLTALNETTKKSELPAGAPTDDLDLEDVTAELMDQFGVDEAGVIAKALSKMVEPLRKENAYILGVIQKAQMKGIADISQRNRLRLGERLPSLKENDDAWRMIHDQTSQSMQREPSKYSSAEAAFDAVFESIYGAVLKAQQQETVVPAKSEEFAKEKARIAASSPTTPSAQKRERNYTSVDAHKAAFRHLFKHDGDVDGAKRSYANMNITQ